MRIRTVCLISAIVWTGIVPHRISAQAQKPAADLMDMSLEDLMKVEIDSVYGASKYKQKVSAAPASITIITAEEIKRYGYRTLADILRDVPGFYATYDRSYSYLGVRGFGRPGDYNTRILLMVDGHRINDNVDDQAFIGEDFPINVNLIDRVEVIRGPNSSLYVASALLGIVNIVTKPERNLQGITVSEEMGTYGTYKSNASYGRQFKNGLRMLLSSTYHNSHGHRSLYFPEFDSPGTNNGIARNVDHERADQVFANLSWGNFTLEGVYGSRIKQIPTASFDSIFNDPEAHTIDTRQYLDLKYDRQFGDDWGVMAHVSYDRYPFDFTAAYDLTALGLPARAVNRQTVRGQWWQAEAAVSKRILNDQTLILGAEHRDNLQQNQADYLEQPYLSLLVSHERSSVSGVYAQDEIPLGANLILDLGIRYDHYSTFGGTTNPRAALIYKMGAQTTLKFLYGQSFRAPNDFELYFQVPSPGGNTPLANPHLKPETAKTTELVFEQGFRRDLHLVVSGYYYPIRGLISAVNDPESGSFMYENSQRVDLKGVEIALKKQSNSGLEAGVSLSLEYARDKDTKGWLTNAPHVLGQANLSVPLYRKKIFASTNIEWVSSRKTLNGTLAGAYVVPNFTLLSRGVLRGWEVSASLYNAFDGIYADPGSVEHLENAIVQDGRTFRLTLSYHH
jgi:outer membrane receptor for ferrienterochelin and colicins